MNVELSERTKTRTNKRRERVKESRHNREYERCIREDIPEYLGRENTREREK
jgi:hypothetical protein